VNIKDVLEKSIAFLKNKNIENSRFEAEYLLQHLLNYKSRVDLYLNFDKPLSDKEIEAYRDYIVKKSKLEPTAYILGYKWFYGHKFSVGPGVLIPRPETEFLVEQAILFLTNELEAKKEIFISDFGSGSGCIGLTVALEISKKNSDKQVCLDLYEKSDEAISYIKKNMEFLVKTNLIKINVIQSDLNKLSFLDRSYDMILANPPYIKINSSEVAEDVHNFEPHLALYCEEEGFECIEKWSILASKSLNQESFLGLEVSHDQSDKTKQFLSGLSCFNEIQALKDHNDIARIVIAKKKS